MKEMIAQSFGIIGLLIIVYSFQCKENQKFFLMQGIGSFVFFLNFLLIGALAGAFFNLTNFVRGLLFSKKNKRLWKLLLIEALYTFCFIFGISLIEENFVFQVFLATLPYVALFIMSIVMYKGNGKYIRIAQVNFMSPSWIVHNIFNFSLGGLICEILNMVSTVVSFIRYGKDGLSES